MISYICAIVVGLLVLAADQISKYYIASNYELGAQGHSLINGIIDITYIHNTGGAWGMLSGHTWLLISITVIVMLVCVTLLLKLGLRNKLIFWAVSLILFGGIGNMIDRIFREGNVIDFLQFAFFREFPVFNIADCGIVIGAFILMAYFVSDIINDSKAKKLSKNGNTSYEQDN